MHGRRLHPLLLTVMKLKAKSTKKLTFAAILSALGFVIMYLGTLTGVFDLCSVVIGSLCCAYAVIEMGGIWPWLIASVTGTLCIVFLPDKFCALEYIALGGLYPILKAVLERLPRVLSFVLKLCLFNLMLTVCLLLAKYLLGISEDWVTFNWVIYLVCNVFFVFYDYALSVFISYYMVKLRHRLKIRF